MNQDNRGSGSGSIRVQWGGYGFMAGIALGVLIGWFFAGFIGAFIRVGLVLLVLVPLVLLYIGWRKFVAPILQPRARREYVDPGYAIETRAVVSRADREPQPR
jgi:hypothetical protein